MYTPVHFEETRIPLLRQLMHRHPLATLVNSRNDSVEANHLPLLLDATAGELGVLKGHVPRANPLWQELGDVLAIFHGPQSYISPSWYPAKRQHGKVVPTWNYAVVHARGSARAVHEQDWLRAHLNALTDHQEALEAAPWKVDDAPRAFTDKLISGLVGIEIEISTLSGKWKVSQNRSDEDRQAVASGLRRRGDDASRAMAMLVHDGLEPG